MLLLYSLGPTLPEKMNKNQIRNFKPIPCVPIQRYRQLNLNFATLGIFNAQAKFIIT